MRITKRVSALFCVFLFFLICATLGIILQYLYPDVGPGPGISGVTYGFMGVVITGIFILSALYRYKRDPSQIRVDEKPYQDERWLRVQEKGAASALYMVLGMFLLCSLYMEYLCRELLGITDSATIGSVYTLFFCLAFAALGVTALSIIYYYYAKI